MSKKTSEAVKRPCSFHDAIVGRLQRKDTIMVPTPWGNAELALRRAAVIAFVGFSFTPTDLHVAALFRIALVGTGQLRVLAEVEDLDVRLVVTGARRAGSEAGA